jgi:hypothetical protein
MTVISLAQLARMPRKVKPVRFMVPIASLTTLVFDADTTGILKEYVALEALHDSSTSFDKPRCHPETRITVLDALDRWAHGRGEDVKPLMWLQGPAGAGKSAIAQTLAERWSGKRQDDLFLIATFVFSRQRPGCNDKLCFVSTIAYQLRGNLTSTAHIIDNAALNDWALFKKSISTQFSELLVRPLESLRQHNLNEGRERTWLIIIDGLDECSTTVGDQNYESQQKEILSAITTVVTSHKLPLRFLIASRPEPQIRNAFSEISLRSITASTLLADTAESRADIELFVRSKFSEIRSQRPYIDPSWPKEEDIAQVVEKSSGHFIYASVVIKYVGHTLGDPISRLETVLHLQGPNNTPKENPYEELDNLYTHILLTIAPDSLPVSNHVFNLILFAQGFNMQDGGNMCLNKNVTAESVEKYLFLRPGEIYYHLVSLNSVLVEIPKGAPIRFIHPSFGDFLCDRSRPGRFCRSDALAQITLHDFTSLLIFCAQEGHSGNYDPPLSDPGAFTHETLQTIGPSAVIQEVLEALLAPASKNELFLLYLKQKAWLPSSFGERLR